MYQSTLSILTLVFLARDFALVPIIILPDETGRKYSKRPVRVSFLSSAPLPWVEFPEGVPYVHASYTSTGVEQLADLQASALTEQVEV